MRLFVFILFFTGFSARSQTVLVMDFVKVKNGKHAETMFFYENNWKLYRDIALGKGYITSYRLVKSNPDSAAVFDIILITEYSDSSMYNRSEQNFRDLLARARPDGPLLLNELKPADFRQNVFLKVAQTVYHKAGTKKKGRSKSS